MLLAIRLVDLGTLVTLVVLDAALLTFAFFLYRYLFRTGTGYVPPDVAPIEPKVPVEPQARRSEERRGAGRTDEAGEVAASGTHALGSA